MKIHKHTAVILFIAGIVMLLISVIAPYKPEDKLFEGDCVEYHDEFLGCEYATISGYNCSTSLGTLLSVHTPKLSYVFTKKSLKRVSMHKCYEVKQ